MEQKNSQELDKKIFSDLIHDPSAITADDSVVLAGLIEKYPYAQLLRSFYTRSIVHSPSAIFEKELAKTALFSNDRVVLQTIIEEPGSIKSKTRGPRLSDQDIAETIETAPTKVETIAPDTSINEPDLIPEAKEPIRKKYDENDNDLAGNLVDSLVNDEEVSPVKAATEQDELDLLVKQNIAALDFLQEDEVQNTVLDKTEDVFTPQVDIGENITHNAVIADQQKVSIYDDDKMPYSFLWWLSKTRNEHANNYQPYVSFQLDTSQSIKRNTVDQLSTQIIENIFHLQSPLDELKNAPKTVPFQVKRKEDFIVEKFIREEPQIKPPNSGKLDSENKARKSAEDPNDLVSETLAHIYTDQMLFHKAIETYKKLSLKFPEKSTYFADQIRDLEKKLN